VVPCSCENDAFNGFNNCTNSAWFNWGRWVFAGAVVLFFILAFVALA
jgi:hypothetical protein